MQAKNRIVATLKGDGKIRLIEEAIPEIKDGWVLIKTSKSLVSPGTELKGWDALAGQKTEPNLLPKPKKFGYSLSGVVQDMGHGVTRLKKGMRVAAIGAGYALHTNYALVPQNLCIEIPQNVSDDDASYAMLMATAMQAVRRADVSIGEYYIISGLGIVGLLSGKLLQMSGCFVAGIDQHQERVDLAKQWGFDDSFLVTDEKLDEKLDAFTYNEGFDGAIVAFGGPADQAMDTIVNHTRIQPDLHHTGTVVTVGWPKFTYDGEIGKMNNIDLRRSSRTGAGYHDAEWEISGKDYPPVLVRWSTLRNLDLCMKLLEKKKIDVSKLTTHHIPLKNVEMEIDKIIDHPEKILGVIFEN
ncbi:MAG: zinc-dependent alcohol dehydrogenase [Sphaerochaeta sp.]